MDAGSVITYVICALILTSVINVVFNFYGISTGTLYYYVAFYIFLVITYFVTG